MPNFEEELSPPRSWRPASMSRRPPTPPEWSGGGAPQESASSQPTNVAEQATSAPPEVDIEDRFRMGGPGKLLPLPLYDLVVVSSDPIFEIWPTLRLQVLAHLRKQSIGFFSMAVCKRCLPTYPDDSALTTVVIIARAREDDKGIIFLRETLSLFARHGYDWLHIELMDPIATGGKLTFPITSSEPVVERWPSLRSRILSELGRKDWRCMQVMRRGYSEEDSKVTVLVSVKDMFHAKWEVIQRRIDAVLKQEDPAMEIEIIQGSEILTRCIPRPAELSIAAFTVPAGMGASLGPHDGSGTLGGYIHLPGPGTATKPFALTCYHVVQTKSMSKVQNEKGVKDAAIENLDVKIDSPSALDVEKSATLQHSYALDYNTNIERLELKVAADSTDTVSAERLVKTRAKKAEFIQNARDMRNFNNSLGNFFSGSGLRQDQDRFAVDWALIEPRPERVTPNMLPDEHAFPGTGWAPKQDTVTSTDVSCLAATEPEQRVFKLGRTTGATWGSVNALKADINLEGDPETLLYTAWDIAPPPKQSRNFSESGDSGSWVFDKDGNLCGILFAGSNPELGQGSGKSHGFVIPIDRVFADIEEITGSKVSLPP